MQRWYEQGSINVDMYPHLESTSTMVPWFWLSHSDHRYILLHPSYNPSGTSRNVTSVSLGAPLVPVALVVWSSLFVGYPGSNEFYHTKWVVFTGDKTWISYAEDASFTQKDAWITVGLNYAEVEAVAVPTTLWAVLNGWQAMIMILHVRHPILPAGLGLVICPQLWLGVRILHS